MTPSRDASSAVPDSSVERRRSGRKPHVCEAWVASPTRTDPFDRVLVQALNLSRHGVGFETDRPVTPGAFYQIQIGIGTQTVLTEIRVTHCRPLDTHRFEVGGEFC